MFENMNKIEINREIKYRFSLINGVFCNHKWDLNTYVNKIYIYENMVKIDFINKFCLSFDVMKKLDVEFPNCDLRVEVDRDRLVLVIGF